MKPKFTMRHALGDPALLADALKGNSWDTWRTLLIASVGEALTDEEREIFKAFTGRDHEPGKMLDTWLTVAGRRSGKTTAIACFVVYLACLCDWGDELALGERGLALYLSPTQDQARRAFGYARSFVMHSPHMAELVENQSADGIKLSNGIDIEIAAANWRYVRGATTICVVLDECAYLRNEDTSANKDTDIVTALRPSLVTTDGPMLLISSPATEAGITYAIHKKHYGPSGDPLILVVQADSKALNPKLDQARIDREFEIDPEAAQAEWGGRFRDRLSGYVPRNLIEACVDKGIEQRRKLPGVQYLSFADQSSGSGKDSFVLGIGHLSRDDGRDLMVIDALHEFKPPFDPAVVVKKCAEILKQWEVYTIMLDDYGGGLVPSMFAKHGINFLRCPKSASELYLHSLTAWTAGMVSMLDIPSAIDQICNLRRKVGQGGQETIFHFGNTHDDVANVIAGLIYRLTPFPNALDGIFSDYIGVVTATRGFSGSDGKTFEDECYANVHGGRARGAIAGNGGSLVW